MYEDIGLEYYMDYLADQEFRRLTWRKFAEFQMERDRIWIDDFKKIWRKEVQEKKDKKPYLIKKQKFINEE